MLKWQRIEIFSYNEEEGKIISGKVRVDKDILEVAKNKTNCGGQDREI